MNEKILVVDDSATVRDSVKQALLASSFVVIEAVDGLDGLKKLGENSDVKLIICDVNMPNMDGLSMCAKLKETNSSIPIFMLTTEANAEMKEKGKAYGVRAWMIKPFNGEKMIAGIKKVIG